MLCLKKIASHQRTTVHYVTQRWHPHIGEEENSACKLHNSHKPEQVAMHLQKFLAFILLVVWSLCFCTCRLLWKAWLLFTYFLHRFVFVV